MRSRTAFLETRSTPSIRTSERDRALFYNNGEDGLAALPAGGRTLDLGVVELPRRKNGA
jgi:hypothetical protein